MVVTIQIQNKQEYEWLLPLLDTLKKRGAAIQIATDEPVDPDFLEKRKSYLRFLNQHAIAVKKVEIPNREERNAR